MQPSVLYRAKRELTKIIAKKDVADGDWTWRPREQGRAIRQQRQK
jgi:hypothetical protein